MIRIGFGYDIHPFKKGKKLYLGGVQIKYPLGLASTTDGDVLIHALIDAILGAMGEGNIGQHFPDSDPQYKGMRSTELLTRIRGLIQTRGFQVNQIDATLIAEKPKLAPHLSTIAKTLGDLLNISPRLVSIKPKSNAGVGPIGQGKAIAAYVVCTIVTRNSQLVTRK